jgi:hypothetical protein
MALLEVKNIYARENHFDILVDGRIRIAATEFHAFRVVRSGEMMAVCANHIRRGDLMWVDVPMFEGDGSLYVPHMVKK